MAGVKDAVTLLGPTGIVIVAFVTVFGMIFAIPAAEPPTGVYSGDCVSSQPGADDGKGPMKNIHPVASTALRRAGITSGMITQGRGKAGQSSGTHGSIPGSPYGAVADISVKGMSEATIKQTVHNLRMQGFVTWYREPGWNPEQSSGNAHIHAAYAGLPAANDVASGQLQTFIKSETLRRNGLADDGGRNPRNFPADTFPTPEEIASVKSVFQGGSGCVGTQTGAAVLEGHSLPVSSGPSCTEMSLAGQSGAFGPVTSEQDEYYITMRWTYAIWYSHPTLKDSHARPRTVVRGNVDNQSMLWHRHKKVLVTNPKNGRQIVASIEDSGPAIWTGRISGLSTKGIQALGFRHGDCGMKLNYTWANQSAALGPVK